MLARLSPFHDALQTAFSPFLKSHLPLTSPSSTPLHLVYTSQHHHVSPGTHSIRHVPSPNVFTNTTQQISQHYSRLLARWPVDKLRPAERHFQRLLEKRIQEAPAGTRDESREVNAAYILLENGLRKRYPVSDAFMHPASKPDHYTALAKELEEAPNRTWFSNWVKRMQNLVRLQ